MPQLTVALRRNESFYTIGTPASASVQVRDNDAPTITVTTLNPGGVIEEGQTARFQFARAGDLSRSFRILVTVANNTHIAIFDAGMPTFNFDVATVDDDVAKPNVMLTATIELLPSIIIGGSASISVVVRDNDEPVATIASLEPNGVVREGETARFQLARIGDTTDALSVRVAVRGADGFRADVPPASVTFAAGRRTAAVRLATVDEPNGELTVTLVAGDAYTLGEPSTAVVQVQDNDAPPLPPVTIAATTTRVTEGGASYLLAIQFSEIVQNV